MPDYEFFCRSCTRQFTAHMSIEEHDRRVAACPECKSDQEVQRTLSQVNVQTTRKSSAYK